MKVCALSPTRLQIVSTSLLANITSTKEGNSCGVYSRLIKRPQAGVSKLREKKGLERLVSILYKISKRGAKVVQISDIEVMVAARMNLKKSEQIDRHARLSPLPTRSFRLSPFNMNSLSHHSLKAVYISGNYNSSHDAVREETRHDASGSITRTITFVLSFSPLPSLSSSSSLPSLLSSLYLIFPLVSGCPRCCPLQRFGLFSCVVANPRGGSNKIPLEHLHVGATNSAAQEMNTPLSEKQVVGEHSLGHEKVSRIY